MKLNTILVRRKGAVARVILHRPRVGNRVNPAMAEDLAQAAALVNDDDSIRVAVVTGHGNVFSCGWERLRTGSTEELAHHQAASVIARIKKPVVAAINGDAIGQGLELALAADIRIAVASARFGLPQIQYGAMPWDGGTQRLPRIAGRANALRLLLTGELVDASETLRMGIINLIATHEEFQSAVDAVATQIVAAGPLATQYTKEVVAAGMDASLDQGLHMEADINILLHTSRDRAEGIRSFLERRTPHFRGK